VSLRQEVALGEPGVVVVRAVADGVDVAASASDATYSIRSPDGSRVNLSGTVSPVTSGGRSVFRITTPAWSGREHLDDGYRLTVSWSDEDDQPHVSQVFFDVVATPWSRTPRPTLDDLRAIRPDIHRELQRIGELSSGQASSAAASATNQARIELDAWLRARAAEDHQIRPALILDVDRLLPIEANLAVALVFEGVATRPSDAAADGGDGETESVARHYRARAKELFAALRCRYDIDQDLIADGQAQAPGVGSIRIVRVQ